MPSRTYPLSNGGSYLASDTRPLFSNSRAGFIACHPPALRRSFSVIGISLTNEQRRAFCAFAKIREQFIQSLLAVASDGLLRPRVRDPEEHIRVARLIELAPT